MFQKSFFLRFYFVLICGSVFASVLPDDAAKVGADSKGAVFNAPVQQGEQSKKQTVSRAWRLMQIDAAPYLGPNQDPLAALIDSIERSARPVALPQKKVIFILASGFSDPENFCGVIGGSAEVKSRGLIQYLFEEGSSSKNFEYIMGGKFSGEYYRIEYDPLRNSEKVPANGFFVRTFQREAELYNLFLHLEEFEKKEAASQGRPSYYLKAMIFAQKVFKQGSSAEENRGEMATLP